MAGRKVKTSTELATRKRDSLDELYDEFVSRTDNPRRLNSLRNLYDTLRHLLSIGSNATSVAAIARSIETLGFNAPKAQSIRNVEGKDFRDLINAYLALIDDKRSGGPSDDEKLVGGIVDLQIAAQVRWILNENRSLKRRLDLLHAAFQTLEPVKLLSASPPSGKPESGGELAGFTKIEIEAVREFQANISDIHCVIDKKSGALLYKGNLEVAPPGFGQALAKLTEESTS
ncbi:gamma-mobile-trio protein GmtX [Bradyrhizobium erythrophlei]|uniref:gamma-mobile-trio protein GmtX n=1 Tax=Bradyrhizobium erythrophlei TaxID=1437360 RepID=UPI0035E7F6C0